MVKRIYCVPLPPDKRRSKHFTLTVTREEKQDGIYSKFQVKRIYICIQQEEVVVGYVVNLKYSSVGYIVNLKYSSVGYVVNLKYSSVGYVVTLNYSSVGYIVILKYSSIGYIVTLKYSSVGYLVALKNSSAGYVVTLKYSSVGYVVTLKHSSLGYIATLNRCVWESVWMWEWTLRSEYQRGDCCSGLGGQRMFIFWWPYQTCWMLN